MSSSNRAWAWVGAGCLVAAGLAAAVPTSVQASTVVNFTDVGSRTWTVPSGVSTLDVVAIGGSGSEASGGGTRGSGGKVTATLTVTAGQNLTLVVGQGGEADGGYGGGSTNINAGNIGNQIIAGGGGGGGNGGDGGAGGGADGAGNDGTGTTPGRGGSGGNGGAGSATGGSGNGGPGGGSGGGFSVGGGYGTAGTEVGMGLSGGAGGGGFGGGGGATDPGAGGGAGGSVGPVGAVYASSELAPSADGSIQLTYTASDPNPPQDATLTVNTTKLKYLPRSGTTTVVKSAAVTPSSAGSLKSIRVNCTSTNARTTARGDVRYCSYKKNLKTGKVKVTTYGSKNVRVKVTLVSEPSTQGGETLRWKQSWAVK